MGEQTSDEGEVIFMAMFKKPSGTNTAGGHKMADQVLERAVDETVGKALAECKDRLKQQMSSFFDELHQARTKLRRQDHKRGARKRGKGDADTDTDVSEMTDATTTMAEITQQVTTKGTDSTSHGRDSILASPPRLSVLR